MKKYFGLIVFFLLVFSSCSRQAPRSAILQKSKVSPAKLEELYLVTDIAMEAVSEPLATQKGKGAFNYSNLPFSKVGGYDDWLRVHQLIFNQVVTLKRRQGKEALVEIPNMVVKMSKKGGPQFLNSWVQVSGLTSLKEIKNRKNDLAKLPIAEFNKNKYPVLTLTKPFYSSKLKKHFSAVTKFTYNKILRDQVEVNVFNAKKMRFETMFLPRSLCYFNYAKRSRAHKLKEYIKLLESWSKNKDGFIPYVFGGASWLESYKKDQPYRVKGGHSRRGKKLTPVSGMDCSTMLYLAALVTDIPYYAKNTTTLANQLETFKKGDHLEPGDLIWVPGHVQLISKVGDRAYMIEARGYSAGFGKVHCLPMEKLLKGHKGTKTLERAFLKGQDLVFLNKAGGIHGTFKNWKLLKFRSIFDRAPPLYIR